ncbi:14054_t:CDS:2 [Dentiscutata erythropus]|uniref:14054_t:CDS:1 n=1 Tax=Dentiscutata erythropus TaxID=1348616 RepID=A0A9N9JI82_9GLOM|nr:14054_t:CDS:2 [Dentiscutata erythropus]
MSQNNSHVTMFDRLQKSIYNSQSYQRLKNKKFKDAIAFLSNRISSTESENNSLNARINSLEYETNFLNARINSLEEKLNQISGPFFNISLETPQFPPSVDLLSNHYEPNNPELALSNFDYNTPSGGTYSSDNHFSAN